MTADANPKMRNQNDQRSPFKRLAFCALIAWTATSGFADVSVLVGTLQPGQSVTISYEVTLDSALGSAVTQISSQGVVSGDNFASLNTDDPETTTADDPTLTSIGNHAPDTGTDTIARSANEDVKVPISTLLSNDTDAESDSVTLTGVISPSPGGAQVTQSGGWIYYAHAGTSADTFAYTVSDGRGGTAQGIVQVQIRGLDAQNRSTLRIAFDGSGAHLQADGIPGRTYTIEYKDDVNNPWQVLGTALSGPAGIYTYNDPAGNLLRIYRSVLY
jgi:hypothetical protein